MTSGKATRGTPRPSIATLASEPNHQSPIDNPASRDLVEVFKHEPTLANYVAWQKSMPDGVHTDFFPGMDGLFAIAPELESFGIDPILLAGVLDGEERDIAKLGFTLCGRLLERQQLELAGKSHIQRRKLAITDRLLDYLAIAMLESCLVNDLPPPFSLFMLLRERLGGPDPYLRQKSRQEQRIRAAVWLGAFMLRNGDIPSMRGVAREMGIEASTVSRWFPNKDFEKQCRDFFALLSKVKGTT